MTCLHVWIEGPEVPLARGGSYLSKLCTECGIYHVYDWYGNFVWEQYNIVPEIEAVLDYLEYDR